MRDATPPACHDAGILTFATYLAPNLRPLYEHVAGACGGRLVTGGDWRELAAAEIDAAFICSPPVHWLAGAVVPIAAPVLTDPRFGGRPLYASEVIVPAGSSARSLADLRGARWAYNEPSSWSGYWVTLARVGAWDHFGSVTAAGYHQEALRMVARGAVDGAAIDCHVLAVELAGHPELRAQVRVVETLGPAPIQPVVVRAGLDPTTVRRLRARLLELPAADLERYLIRGFVPPPDYSPIFEVLRSRADDRGDRHLEQPSGAGAAGADPVRRAH
jgi:phosphonate transport system substrate-binding protein